MNVHSKNVFQFVREFKKKKELWISNFHHSSLSAFFLVFPFSSAVKWKEKFLPFIDAKEMCFARKNFYIKTLCTLFWVECVIANIIIEIEWCRNKHLLGERNFVGNAKQICSRSCSLNWYATKIINFGLTWELRIYFDSKTLTFPSAWRIE